MKKWVIGGVFKPISGRKREDWPFLARNGPKWPKITDFGGLGGPRTPSFRGPWGPYQAPRWGGKMTWKWPIFPLNHIGFWGHFDPQSTSKYWNHWFLGAIFPRNPPSFWSKNGYFHFIERSSFFLFLEKIWCELTLVLVIRHWGPQWGPIGTGIWGGIPGGLRPILGLFCLVYSELMKALSVVTLSLLQTTN